MNRDHPAAAPVLELLVPGLLGPIPPAPDQQPSTPTLDWLLARGKQCVSPRGGLDAALLARFAADASAPYCLAVDDPDWDRTGFFMHAEPVHLRPDRDLLRLFDARHLDISAAEAKALVAALNHHFAADGLRFSAPGASRWYLHCEQPPALQTRPLADAVGRHIDGLLPSGPDAARWASLMTEAQMLLFQTPVNQRREAAGRPAVNGLWIWGGGVWGRPSAPDLPQRLLIEQRASSAPLAAGLAAAAGVAVEGIETGSLSYAVDTLMVWDRLQEAVADADQRAWAAGAEALDQRLRPMADALRSGALGRIIVDACDGRRWSISGRGTNLFWPRALQGLWRRSPTLAQRADQAVH
jgi:hypothetical protein